MALSKSFSAQSALKTCDEHEMEELDMYCKTCEKPICEECVKQQHIRHDWCKISKMARQLRTQIPDRERKISSQANAFFSGRRKVIKYVREKYDATMADNTKNLENVRSDMHSLVDNIIDGHINECQSHREKVEEKLLDMETLYNPCENKINQLANCLRSGSYKYNDFDLIELYDDFRCQVTRLETLPDLKEDLFEQKHFVGQKPDKEHIKSVIGSVATISQQNKTKHVKIAELKLKETGIGCIEATSENEALIKMIKSVQLIAINGDVKMTMHSGIACYNFATTSDEKIIVCDDKENKIKVIDQSDKCSVLFDTGDLHPALVCITNAGELLISMWDEDSYSRTSSSRRLVKRMTMEGEEVCVYEYDNDGKTPLFHRPIVTVEHSNGDVSIIDKFRNDNSVLTGVIYGFDIRGNKKFRYSGQSDNHPFNPLGLCCDMLGNTITADCSNRTVHLINKEGHFVRYLITHDMVNQDLCSVSLYGNSLWVGGYDTGVVYVFNR